MTEQQAELICIFGARGGGKSTVGKHLCRGKEKLIVFDVMAEYTGDRFVRCETLAEVGRAVKSSWQSGFKISFIPDHSDYLGSLHSLAGMVWAVQEPFAQGRDPRQLTLVVEEAHMGFPNTQLPRDKSGMMRLVTMGRHRGIEAIAITQRPAMLNTNYRANSPRHFIFPLEWEEDQAAVLKTIGKDHAETLRTLQPFNFILRERGSIRMGKTAKNGGVTLKK